MVAVDYDKDFIDFYCQLYIPQEQKPSNQTLVVR